MLHLATYPLRMDPECWCIMATFKDARAFATSDAFRHTLQEYAVHTKQSNGPVGVLVARARRVGWRLLEDGCFADSIGHFDVLSCSWEQVLVRLKVAWASLIGSEVFHRDSMSGCHRTDLYELQRSLQTYDATSQALLRNHLDGTLFTQSGRAHFEENNEGQCPWCREKDGFYHRLWECPFFTEDRQGVPADVLEQIPTLPKCLTCHGWPIRASHMDEWLQMLELIPAPDVGQVQVGREGTRIHLFIDGSCAQTDEPSLRLASWAVTQAAEIPALQNDLLMAGPVPGMIQSAYRAELWALLCAVRLAIQAGLPFGVIMLP